MRPSCQQMVLAQHCSSRDAKHRDPPPYPGPGTGCALYQPGEELFVLGHVLLCLYQDMFVFCCCCIVGFESEHACSVTLLSGYVMFAFSSECVVRCNLSHVCVVVFVTGNICGVRFV